MNSDGSGTWTRFDASATRFRDLYLSGPSRAEVTYRETFDREDGQLIDVTRNFASCKDRCPLLPEPAPRSLRTVFHFASTKAAVPPDAQSSPVPEAASTAKCSESLIGGPARCADTVPPPPSDTPLERPQQDAVRPVRYRDRLQAYFAAFSRLPRGP